MVKRSLGLYIARSIAVILVVTIMGGVLQFFGSGHFNEIESNYTKESRSRLIREYAKENSVYTVTKLNMEERGGILAKYHEYYVTMDDGSDKAKTIKVDAELYYSLNVGDKVDYQGNIVTSSSGK